MPKRSLTFAAMAWLLLSPALAAEPEAKGRKFSFSFERHYTANAFDSIHPFADWYRTLRGSLEQQVEIGGTRITFGGALEVKAFDTYDIEDDRVLALSLGAERKLGERLELRGSVGWRIADEGDDLAVEDTIIGLRTATESFVAAAQLGADLGQGWALILDAGASRETPRKTRFEADVIEPVLLNPRKDRIELGLRLGHTQGGLTLAGASGAEWVLAGRQADAPLQFELVHFRTQAEAKYAVERLTLTGSAGLAHLSGLRGALATTRPIYALAAEYVLTARLVLRASLSAGFDTRNTDDPVASWLERQEVEARLSVREKLSLGIGLYNSWREYLTLGGGEKAYGLYAETSYNLSKPVTLVLRVEQGRASYQDGSKVPRFDAGISLRAAM
ncbi:MAG TPA: hypothetical protein VNS02_03040 [Rhizobiaceae bacterium]|nr:hypothetical protein [Rhizobiaceae bacterium]